MSEHEQNGGTVVPFRRERGEVVEAELVADQPRPTWGTRLVRGPSDEARARMAESAVVLSHRAGELARHDRTRATARAVARNVLYVPAGVGVVVKRVWEAKTTSRHERLMRAAEAAGDWDKLAEWEARAERARERRHRRRMDWVRAPFQLVKALLAAALAGVGVLAGIGLVLAVSSKDAADFLDPFTAAIEVIRWVVMAVAVAWTPLVMAAPWLVVGWLWWEGKRAGNTPTWLAPPRRVQAEGEPITPSTVVVALRDLGIPALRKAVQEMGDAGAGLLGPIRIAGCGVEVDVTLPRGVATDEVQRRRRKLAENLDRHEHELHICVPQAARTVRLWIADSGALDEPIGPSPLVVDPEQAADLYTGRAPWGQDLRGDQAAIALLQRHVLVTGLSNQGKTAALRALALWLALDPTTELRIADLKGVGDWRMFDGLATTLIQGPTDEHVQEATEMLEEGVREMQRRIAALEASGATDGVTRAMARKPGSGLHPIFLVVDEAQVAFMCPAKGENGQPLGGTKATSRYFMASRKIHNQGRAVNVLLWQGTQDPTDQNLPKLVREGAHIRVSLVVGTEEQARMALGDKAVNGGAAPHKLRQGVDKGTVGGRRGRDAAPGRASLGHHPHPLHRRRRRR